SDLVGFAACAHLTQLERKAARGEIEKPHRADPLLDLISRRGSEHEQGLLEGYELDGDVTEIRVDMSSRAGLERSAADTEHAMRRGDALVYQATFLHDGWVGHADFVRRVET